MKELELFNPLPDVSGDRVVVISQQANNVHCWNNIALSSSGSCSAEGLIGAALTRKLKGHGITIPRYSN